MKFVRPSKDYSFYGQTMSLCETCLKLVHAKIVIEDDNVFYLKRCPSHGMQKTLVSTDAAYFKSCKDFIKPGDLPLQYQSATEHGCPYDCGLCPDHEQHSCLALIEINDACNLSCPVCFADSSPQRTRYRSLAEVDAMLETLVASEGNPDLVQISGGEPSIHPNIIEILRLAKSKPIRHVMLNTNGIRIATDPAFVAELAGLKPGFEIYLQFDSLRREALENLRGADLRKMREQALANLEEAGISTTLVCVVKKGVNDDEVGAIVRHALSYQCVRGITFQPVQDAGRNLDFDKDRDRTLLTDIRRAIATQAGEVFTGDDIHSPALQSGLHRHRLWAAERRQGDADHPAYSQERAVGRRSEHDVVRTLSGTEEPLVRSSVAGVIGRAHQDRARRPLVLPAADRGAERPRL